MNVKRNWFQTNEYAPLVVATLSAESRCPYPGTLGHACPRLPPLRPPARDVLEVGFVLCAAVLADFVLDGFVAAAGQCKCGAEEETVISQAEVRGQQGG